MTDEKQSELQIIEKLKERFEAEMVGNQHEEEDLQFLEERSRLEEMTWRYVDYVEYYDLIEAYGLELKLMERFKGNMVWSLENSKAEFLKSEFYQKFKTHDTVKWAVSEYKRSKN